MRRAGVVAMRPVARHRRWLGAALLFGLAGAATVMALRWHARQSPPVARAAEMEEVRIRPPAEIVAALPPFPRDDRGRRYILLDYAAHIRPQAIEAPPLASYLIIPSKFTGPDIGVPTAAWGVLIYTSFRDIRGALDPVVVRAFEACEPDCPGELRLLIENRSSKRLRGAALAADDFRRRVEQQDGRYHRLEIEKKDNVTVFLNQFVPKPNSTTVERVFEFFDQKNNVTDFISCHPFVPNPQCVGSIDDEANGGIFITYHFDMIYFSNHTLFRDLIRHFIRDAVRLSAVDLTIKGMIEEKK